MNAKNVYRIFYGLALTLCIGLIIMPIVYQSRIEALLRSNQDQIDHLDSQNIEEKLSQARKYNQDLCLLQRGILADEMMDYDGLLVFDDSGVMARLRIPCIDVDLPIYHGTHESVLEKGIGHVAQSSLPVDQKGSHIFLTGHRGLTNALLLTRLDEIQKEDRIYIDVGNITLVYQVDSIEIKRPEQIKTLHIDPVSEVLSLMTCTPYGINTHRLIVQANRIDSFDQTEQTQNRISISYILARGIPIVCFVVLIGLGFKKKKKEVK